MPELAHSNDQSNNATSSSHSLHCSSGFWSKHGDDIDYNQLQKFWCELSPQARQDLLRIDKQTLFEQARKNMYCSRCNGLLLEVFMQIVVYGKSLQQEGAGGQLSLYKLGVSKNQINLGSSENLACKDEVQDPFIHPWGGLTTTKEGVLTLSDCYLYSKSLQGLQHVFDSARAREREREMHYPDACGGGGRGWISQGMVSYGRGHGTRETCALHTARLSCDTLVDFWSALSDDTRYSLLRMKEEDFIERLMCRFDSKRFCRDCRRNVIREFKELKELKRMRREPRCTTWFCVADTAFQYEVSNSTIHADWNQTFTEAEGKYHHYEWAVGTGEGKSDILDFENVGVNGRVQAKGLDLGGLNACYITLRAWKLDGRCTELSVKAHALKGEQCVHCRLMVGDGYLSISRGESIRRFFEHAEEAEEEEDDNSMDNDGNELDDECSRPQKHAKSPELAREFLLDAATVIFKEQVEKAFREGTARQNAHSIFVCLALELLEERAHVACKDIITLEKQVKLIEEEEKEKREEEERKEKKRTKEREKKLRRKERLRRKDTVNKCIESTQISVLPDFSTEVFSPSINQESDNSMEEIVSDYADPIETSTASPDSQGDTSTNDYAHKLEYTSEEDEDELFTAEELPYKKSELQTEYQLDLSRRWPGRNRGTESGCVVYQSESWYCNGDSECSSRESNGRNKQSRSSAAKFTSRNCGPRFNHKLQCMNNRMTGRNDLHSCSCNRNNDYKEKVEPHALTTRFSWEKKSLNKMDSASDSLKPVQRFNKLTQTDHTRDNCGRSRSKIPSHGNSFRRELLHTKKVWEPVEPQKRYPRCSSDSDVTLSSSSIRVAEKSRGETRSFEVVNKLRCADSMDSNLEKSCCKVSRCEHKPFLAEAASFRNSEEAVDEEDDSFLTRSCKSSGSPDFSVRSSSSSDNCSSCLSEGDGNTAYSTLPVQESSSTSDLEEGSQLSEGRDTSLCTQISFSEGYCEVPQETVQNKDVDVAASKMETSDFVSGSLPGDHVTMTSPQGSAKGTISPSVETLQQGLPPQILNMQNICYPTYQAPPMMGYYNQNQQVSWPTTLANGFVPYAHPNPYFFTSPFSYTLSGDSNYCIPLGAVQHLPSPLLNAAQVPVYQPLLHTISPSHFQEQKCFPTSVVDPFTEVRREKAVQTGPSPNQAPTSVCEQKKTDAQTGNTGFSLFKFSGPVPRPLSTIKPDTNSLDEGSLEDPSSDFSADHENVGQACNKKDTTIEQYNLFAASKGIKFSIF